MAVIELRKNEDGKKSWKQKTIYAPTLTQQAFDFEQISMMFEMADAERRGKEIAEATRQEMVTPTVGETPANQDNQPN